MIDIEKLKKLSEADSNVPLHMKFLKLTEEVGEVSSAYLAYAKCPNASKSEEGTVDNLAEEILDTIIVCNDLLNNLPVSAEYLKAIADRKLAKWESKIGKN